MNNFFDLIDKFKFGIVAAIAAYIGIFMYFQMESYTRYFPIEPFHDGAYVETPEDIELNPENIQLPPDYDGGDIKNMVSDMNDTRDKSYENYTQNNGGKATNIKELEAQMYKEAGGSAERERLKKLIEEQKQNNSNKKEKKPEKNFRLAIVSKDFCVCKTLCREILPVNCLGIVVGAGIPPAAIDDQPDT